MTTSGWIPRQSWKRSRVMSTEIDQKTYSQFRCGGLGLPFILFMYSYITSKMKSSFLGGTPSSNCRRENDTFWRNLKNISPKKLQSFVNLVVNLSHFQPNPRICGICFFSFLKVKFHHPRRINKLYNETPRSPNCWQCFGRFAWNLLGGKWDLNPSNPNLSTEIKIHPGMVELILTPRN